MSNKIAEILLVDDDRNLAEIDSILMEKEGFAVIHAPDAERAFEILKSEEKIDLILMDIALDGPKDGITAASEILNDYDIPIVFLTAAKDRETLNKINEITVYGYVQKSGGIGVLTTTINMALKLHRAQTEIKEKEKTLYESEKRYKAIYNTSAIGIIQADFEGHFTDANPAFLNILGYSEEELKKMSWNDITHPNDKEKSTYHYLGLKEGKLKNYSLEKRYIHKNGSTVWVNASVVAVANEEGIPVYELGIVEDITKRKEAERALTESEARFRDLFDEAPIGYHEIDENGILTRVNQTELRMLGYTAAEDMLGKHVSDFVAQTEQSKKEVQKKLSGKLNVGNTYRRDFIRKDGSKIPVAVCDRLIIGRDGSLTGIRSTIQDISDIKRAEDALIKSETKYRNIFENVQDVFFRTDVDGVITEISPSIKRYTGFGVDYLLGRSSYDLYYTPEDRIKLRSLLQQKGEVNDFEIFLKDKNDNPLIVSLNAHLLYDDNNAITGIEGSLRDITDRKRSEMEIARYTEELKNLNATKDKFFSIIAHDLKNPFNSILILAEMFSTQIDAFSQEELKELSEELFKSAGNVYRLLEDLLEWSRVESGRMPFVPQNLYCSHEIELVLTLHKKSAENKLITLVNKCAPTVMVYADAKMLQMVLRNLVSNAIKFSFEKSIITVEVSLLEEEVLFAVQDFGVGISEEGISKLFKIEEYYSTEGTKNEKGTGLGLILCYDIIKKHNGKIWVESSKGNGSRFCFTIPKLKE